MTFAQLFRAAAGAVAVWALAVQFMLLVQRFDGDVGAAALRFFNYFTILSNLVGATAFLAPAFIASSRLGRFFSLSGVRTAVTLYLVVVGVVYHAILAPLWEPKGWQLAVDIVLHTVTPAAMTADWLFLTPKRNLSAAYVRHAVLFPLGYAAWALSIGGATGFYPYPFIDANKLAVARIGFNIVVLLGLFAVLGALLAALGRRLAQSAATQK